MIWILAAALILQCLAVGLAVRLNWVHRHHRSWWVISAAVALMAVQRGFTLLAFLGRDESDSANLVSGLASLNVSVLSVVGLWLLRSYLDGIHRMEQELRSQHQKLNELLAQGAIELGNHIGRRKQAELAERDLNAIYHSLVETLPMSIIRKDRQGRFVFANSAACNMLARSREDLLNKTDADLFEPGLAGKYQRDDKQVLATGHTIEDVEDFRSPTGELRYVQILKTPVCDSRNAIVGTQVIFWDVTERRQAIEALARNESIKSAMFEAALDGIIIIDHRDRIVDYNPAAKMTFGYAKPEVVGQEMAALLMPPLSGQRHRENLSQYLGSGTEGSMMLGRPAISMQRKDGSLFTAELSLQPIPLDDSTGFTVFVRDITERERAASELARQQKLIEQTNAELQQEVQVRTRAEEETKLRNQDLKTLLYVISHDLREPLRSVRNFAKLIEERYASNLDDKGRDFLSRIIRGANRLDRQLEDVLTLSRAQRLIEPDEQVPLGDVVRDVLQQLEMRIQETGAKVEVVAELPTVLADRSWVVQAVLNLVSNSLKFTRPGTPPEISIRPLESNAKADHRKGLIVADRGPGVPPEHAERIFDLFQRAVGREVEGTGAGLAIVRRIAERHGGKVWHQPREGGGSEFYLAFGEPTESFT